jgi:hypothetical protein
MWLVVVGGSETLIFCDDLANMADTIRRLRQGENIWEIFLFIVLIAEVYVANRRVSKDEQTEPLPRIRTTSRRSSVRDWIVRQEAQTV